MKHQSMSIVSDDWNLSWFHHVHLHTPRTNIINFRLRICSPFNYIIIIGGWVKYNKIATNPLEKNPFCWNIHHDFPEMKLFSFQMIKFSSIVNGKIITHATTNAIKTLHVLIYLLAYCYNFFFIPRELQTQKKTSLLWK